MAVIEKAEEVISSLDINKLDNIAALESITIDSSTARSFLNIVVKLRWRSSVGRAADL